MSVRGPVRCFYRACSRAQESSERSKAVASTNNLEQVNKKRTIATFAAVLAGFLALPKPSAAATDIYLQLTGITGESTVRNYRGYIQLLSYSQSVQSSATIGSAAGGAGAGKAICGQINLAKHLDAASPRLIQAVMTGQHYSQAIISFVDTQGNGAQQTDYVVTLQDIIFTSVQESDSCPAKLTETVSLIAKSFRVDYVPYDAKGVAGSPQKLSVNCATNFAQ